MISCALERDATEWKIDNIKGASDGEPWSVPQMLTESLKSQAALRRSLPARTGRRIAGRSLRVVGKLLIAQVPILPELQRAHEDDEPAKDRMPDLELGIVRIAEDEG